MIYKDSLESIIEALYLDDLISNSISKSNIRVNPKFDKLQLNYTIGKIIILNDLETDPESIKILVKNNTIISRVNLYNNIEGVKFHPYITRINFNVMWSGETLQYKDTKYNTRSIIDWVGKSEIIDTKPESKLVLYFPKIKGLKLNYLMDSEGYLTSLGWILHQVGQNIDLRTKFKDMDLLKIKKILV